MADLCCSIPSFSHPDHDEARLSARLSACLAATKVGPGDYVQFKSWFGDVWAEVLSVYGEPGNQSVSFCRYNKGGSERWIGHEYESLTGIRDVIPKAEVQYSLKLASCKRGGVVYSASEYWGGFGRSARWPSALSATDRLYSNNRQKMPTDAVLLSGI